MSRAMKDSGVEWIGQIPNDKAIIRNKYIISYVKGKNPENINSDKIGRPYIGAQELDADNCINYENYTTDNLPNCQCEDTLILWDGARAGLLGRHHKGCMSSTIVKLEVNEHKIYNPFVFWYLKGFEKYLIDMVGGTTIPHMNRKYIESIQFISFSIQEQQKIAEYLDKRCREIDDVLEKQSMVIGKLKEYKQSLITEAVTKGLNPNAQMKDSGIEWIGKIPAHWEVSKISTFFNIILGKMLCSTPNNETDTLENYLCSLNIKFEGLKIDEVKKMYFSENEKKQYLLKNGDILVAEGGDAGTVSEYKGEVFPCYIQNAVHKIYSKNNDKSFNKFLYYWMFFIKYSGYLDLICNKATIKHYTKEKVSKTPLAVSSLQEQQEIADYLDKRCGEIDGLISKKQEIIGKLNEYKKSLIYECVTGKKEIA